MRRRVDHEKGKKDKLEERSGTNKKEKRLQREE